MNISCLDIEELMNYLRVVLEAEEIFYFNLDEDRIMFVTKFDCCSRKVSLLIDEMREYQKKEVE